MDLVRYLRVLRRRWRVIAILAVLGAAAGALLVPKPEAKTPGPRHRVDCGAHLVRLVGQQQRPASDSLLATVTAEQAAFLVKSGDVPDRVAEADRRQPG